MMIRSYSSLSLREQSILYEYLLSCDMTLHTRNLRTMQDLYGSEVFEQGESHFSIWNSGEVTGAMGVITREVADRGEVFITGVYFRPEHAANVPRLLARCLAYLLPFGTVQAVRLGLSSGGGHLLPLLEEQGFMSSYSLYTMLHDSEEARNRAVCPVELIPLGQDNAEDYRRIHNAAFASSPNGATMSEEQLRDMLCTSAKAGVARRAGETVGIYRLEIDSGVGWIVDIAIDPNRQGRGLGSSLLKQLTEHLYELGAEQVQLTVISSNERALNVYRRSGFRPKSSDSTWLELCGLRVPS